MIEEIKDMSWTYINAHVQDSRKKEILDKINETIRQNNKIEKWIEKHYKGKDVKEDLPCNISSFSDLPSKHDKQKEYKNIDDIAIVEVEISEKQHKKNIKDLDKILSVKPKNVNEIDLEEEKQSWQKKLEEADKYFNNFKNDVNFGIEDPIYNPSQKLYGYGAIANIQKKYKQVISKLIKDNEFYKKQTKQDRKIIFDLQNMVEQLQQKHPDQESDFYKRYRQTKEELQQLKKKKLSKKCMTWLQENINKIGIELYCREILKYFKEE